MDSWRILILRILSPSAMVERILEELSWMDPQVVRDDSRKEKGGVVL